MHSEFISVPASTIVLTFMSGFNELNSVVCNLPVLARWWKSLDYSEDLYLLCVTTFSAFVSENSALGVAAVSPTTSRLSNDLRICEFPSVFHGSPVVSKTEQGCEFRTPPPSSRSPQRDHTAQDPLAHPSGFLRFYPINSKGLRASQLLTRPNLGTRSMTMTRPKGSILGKRL